MSDPQPINMKKARPIIILGIVFIFLLIFGSRMFIILDPTERGVVFKKYTSGLDIQNVRGEGLNIIAPWNDMIKFDIEEQQTEETMDVLSADGLSINIDVSLRFRPKPDQIGYLYKAFKKNYINNLIRPELRSEVRRIIGQYSPEELYATKRQEIETRIEESTRAKLDTNYIELKALLFRSIKLPESIKNSIEEKLKADQEAQKQKYLIEKAKLEAEQREIEAQGKANANRILNASLTSNILKEKGISATEALANSPNAKIIVIGSGGDGLPLILGGN